MPDNLPASRNIIVIGYVVIAILALIGFGLVLHTTNPHGAGISPDSVGYLGVARSLSQGAGLMGYDGKILSLWPPLYSLLLGIIAALGAGDPADIANEINAILFGAIIFMTGALAMRLFQRSFIFVLATTATVGFAPVMFGQAIMALSETLFIACVMGALLASYRYQERGDMKSLLVIASGTALATMTRYIGIIMIPWGVILIILYSAKDIRKCIKHLAIFLGITVGMLGAWLIRTTLVSGGPFGFRAHSAYTFHEIVIFTAQTIGSWYLPPKLFIAPILVSVCVVLIFLLALLAIKQSRPILGGLIPKMLPLALFCAGYVTFLVYLSTTAAHDRIGDRLLSPIYIPLTLCLLLVTQAIGVTLELWLPRKFIQTTLIVGMSLWLLYPIRSLMIAASNPQPIIQGYGGPRWKSSETAQYFKTHAEEFSKYALYTNDAYASYFCADVIAERSPFRIHHGSRDTAYVLEDLPGHWPESEPAVWIWFDKPDDTNFFSPEDLGKIAHLELERRFSDGAIYKVMRRSESQ